MKFDNIKGNVTADGYKDWIQIDSMSFNVSRMINSPMAGVESDREASVAGLSEIQITKKTDLTSPQFFANTFQAPAAGSDIQIHFCRSGDKLQKYIEFTIGKVINSTYVFEASGDGEPYETLSLNCSKLEMKYTPFDADHKPGSPMDADFDLASAEK